MKNFNVISFITCLSSFLAYASQAQAAMEESFKIEICVLPLKEIVIPSAKGLVGTLQHMFPRGTEPGKEPIGLHYEPIDPTGFVNGAARIDERDYKQARCETVLGTDDRGIYEEFWNSIKSGFDHYAAQNNYKIVGSNCQDATKSVFDTIGLEIPIEILEILDKQETFGMNQAQLGELAKSPLGQLALGLASNPKAQEECVVQ
jgi:hypothetical protein